MTLPSVATPWRKVPPRNYSSARFHHVQHFGGRFHEGVPLSERALHPPFQSGWLAYGTRWAIDLPAHIYLDSDGYSYSLEVDFDPGTAKPVCRSLHVSSTEDGPPVEQDALRVPISSWIALDSTSLLQPDDDDEFPTWNEYVMPPADRFKSDPDYGDLDAFCDLWTWLRLRGEPAGAVIAAKYGVKPPTTSRWIARARKLGLLDETHTRI